MTEEAREAAWAEHLARFDWEVAPDIWFENFASGFDAGVAEGIRQARESVQAEYDDDSPIEPPQYWAGISGALAAIDALESKA